MLFLQDFKRKVKMPKLYREDEEPVDAAEIRKILLNCNRRLKSHLLVFGGRGTRAVESTVIRLRNRPFSKFYKSTHKERKNMPKLGQPEMSTFQMLLSRWDKLYLFSTSTRY